MQESTQLIHSFQWRDGDRIFSVYWKTKARHGLLSHSPKHVCSPIPLIESYYWTEHFSPWARSCPHPVLEIDFSGPQSH